MMSSLEKLVWLIPALLLTPFIAVAAVMPGVFNSELHLRARSREEGAATVYRVRPIARLPALLFVLCMVAGFVSESGLHGTLRWAVTALLDVTVLVLYSRLPYRVVLDHEGIHSYRFFRPQLSIAWNDLEDVETRGTKWNLFSNATYWFRSAGRTKLLVDEMGFEVDDLLRRIRSRHPCPEYRT